MENQGLKDSRLRTVLQNMATKGIENAALGLSGMIGERIKVSVPAISVVPISTVPERVGGAETQVVGTYLACEGDMGGHVMMITELEDALRLTDLLLGQKEGETKELDALARSALAEAGNVTASFFLNAISNALGMSTRPTPPAVIVDMAGAILDIMLVTAGQLSDEILLLEAAFEGEGRELKLYFWMVPDLDTLNPLIERHSRG